MSGPFLEEVKQELASAPIASGPVARAELAAALRFGGALVLVGGSRRHRLDLETASGATARRVFALLQTVHGVRPELRVRAPGGVQVRQRYGLRVDLGGAEVARELGLVDDHGMPTSAVPTPGGDDAAAASGRGAFLAAGSVSSPGRPPHLEVAAHDDAAAEALAVDLRRLVDGTVTVSSRHGERPRVVLKSGATVGDLLAALGASRAFLRWDDRRLRRQLRGEATRLANADAANLRRTVAAAAAQVEAVRAVVDDVGWDGLDDDLRAVALARLTSPDASITELGQLTDPPTSRSAVHRRLRRLTEMAEEVRGHGGAAP